MQQGPPSQPMPPPPPSQFSQRSVPNEHKPGDSGNSGMKERHMMRRHLGSHHMMRRQADAVPYPSKEAYDSYIVNNYRNQYDEVYPTYAPAPAYSAYSAPSYSAPSYSAPSYTTTTAKAEYYVPRY